MKDALFLLRNCVDRQRCMDYIHTLPFTPMPCVDISLKIPTRSTQQNRLYWKWTGIVGKHKGYDSEEMHEAFKRNFLGLEEHTDAITGEVYQRPVSSARLEVPRFTKFMDKVYTYATSEGLHLPQPQDWGMEW